MGAEGVRYLTSGRAYVQDERYFAKEHMDVRREACQAGTVLNMRLEASLPIKCCAYWTQAALAHPCARGIPFILNISES